MDPRPFFAFAQERHRIYMRRRRGEFRPWTMDPILSYYKFTNTFRELDRTTAWIRHHIREPLDGTPLVLPAMVAARWFNRIEFLDHMLNICGGARMWILNMLEPGARAELLEECRKYPGPYVTGAYIVQSPSGMDKLTGVFEIIGKFCDYGAENASWQHVALRTDRTLRTVWLWLCEFPHMGPFMAYEVVSDLRHTHLLRSATDIMTWANAGPGAMRGLNRLHGRRLAHRQKEHTWCAEMMQLLQMSHDDRHWPADFPTMEMRDVEHTLCEFDKYERVRLGQGAPRGVFRVTGDITW